MKRFILIICFLSMLKISYAESVGTITGRVEDEDWYPIIGASIVIKGTTNGTISDYDGNFTLHGVSIGDIIQVSYIGYVTQEIKISTHMSTYIITLEEDNWGLLSLSESEQEKSINEYIEKLYVLTKNDSTYMNTIFLYDKKNKEIQFIPKQ